MKKQSNSTKHISENTSKSRGMAFGVFDSLHPGHKSFLSSAAQACDELIVVVTLSEVVELLKGKLPVHSFEDRVSEIIKYDPRLTVVSGDAKVGTWDVLKKYSPDKIFLGYDQQSIAKELDRLGLVYEFIKPYHPEKYKSSLMNRV